MTTNGARNGKDISGALNRLLDALNKLKDLTVAHGDEEGREQELQAKLLKDDLDRLEQAVVNGESGLSSFSSLLFIVTLSSLGSSLLPQLAQRVVLRKTKVDQAPLVCTLSHTLSLSFILSLILCNDFADLFVARGTA